MASTSEFAFPQLPPLFDATPASLVSDAQELVEDTKRVWDDIVATITPQTATWDNTITRIIQDENQKSTVVRVLRFYASTSPVPELRAASRQATTLFDYAEIDQYARQDMFSLVDAVLHGALDNLDGESRYYLERLHRRFYRNGCGISDTAAREQFAQRAKMLKDLVHEFSKNMHEERAGLWLTPDELDGVPAQHLARLRKGEAENEGKLWLPTKVPQSEPVLASAVREETRKKVYYAIENRMPANVGLHRQIMLLRDETARMLGYDNHAALRIAEKMMKTPAAVNELLDRVRRVLAPRAVQLADEMLQLKKADAAASDSTRDKLFLWDRSYYARIQDEKDRLPNQNISEYFELHTTLAKLLNMFEHLFNLRFERITAEQQEIIGGGKPLVWDPDVLVYAVWDQLEETEFMGFAYFDFYPRQGKYSHGGHYTMQQGFLLPDGTRFYPSSAVVMNYNRPGDLPTLLSLIETRKLFHEIGHLIHSLCTRTKFANSHQVDRDFVEAPSIMFEQFFFQKRHIKDASCHYSHISPEFKQKWLETLAHEEREHARQPEAQLGDETVAALARVNYGKNARNQLGNLALATYDMLIHTPTSHQALENTNLAELFNKTKTSIIGVSGGEAVGDGWEWGHGESVFRSIHNSYDAGYYSYLMLVLCLSACAERYTRSVELTYTLTEEGCLHWISSRPASKRTR